jgi:hypothetical protein
VSRAQSWPYGRPVSEDMLLHVSGNCILQAGADVGIKAIGRVTDQAGTPLPARSGAGPAVHAGKSISLRGERV